MRILKIILLSFILPASVMALNQYELLVNTPQEVSMYAALFDGIHFFFHGTTGENYLSLLRVIVLFGTLLTVLKAVASVGGTGAGAGGSHTSLMAIASYQIFVVFLLSTLFARESQLIVKHPQSLTFDVSATIPDVFGYTVSFFSGLNYKMTEIAESSFADIRNQNSGQIYDINSYNNNIGYGMTGMGYAGLPNALSKIAKVTTSKLANRDGQTISQMFRAYSKDCVIMPLSINNPRYSSVLLNATNLWDNIKPSNISIETGGVAISSMLVEYPHGTFQLCSVLYDNMDLMRAGIYDNMERVRGESLAALYYANFLMKGSFSGGSYGSTATTTALISDAEYTKGQLIDTAMANDYQGIFEEFGKSGNVFASGAASSVADIQQNGMSSGVFMGQFLPVFSSFIFMVMIASFPFMFAFSLLPGGIQILVQFVKTLAWVSLWSPMAAVLNFFIDYRMMERLKESGKIVVDGNGYNIEEMLGHSDIISMSSEAATMAGLAGYLYLMVPGLSWMLVTGSGIMMSNITGSLGSSFQKNSSADTVSEKGAAIGAAEGANTTVAEQGYYAVGAKMAQTQAAYTGQKEAYGDDFSAMASDQSKTVAQQHGQSKGAGEMMTLSGAVAGGIAQGKMSGASTQSMGEMGESRSNSQYKDFGDESAGKQMGAVDGAKGSLKEHGGREGIASDQASNARNAAMKDHTGAKAVEKSLGEGSWDSYSDQTGAEAENAIGGKGKARKAALDKEHEIMEDSGKEDRNGHAIMQGTGKFEKTTAEDIQKGMENVQTSQIAETGAMGAGQTSGQAAESGHQSGRNKAISMNATAEAQANETDERLKKTAEVAAGQQVTAANAAASDAGVQVAQQIADAVTEAIKGVGNKREEIDKAGGAGNYLAANKTEAGHAGAKLKETARLTNKAESLDGLAQTEMKGYAGTVGESNITKSSRENLAASVSKNNDIASTKESLNKAESKTKDDYKQEIEDEYQAETKSIRESGESKDKKAERTRTAAIKRGKAYGNLDSRMKEDVQSARNEHTQAVVAAGMPINESPVQADTSRIDQELGSKQAQLDKMAESKMTTQGDINKVKNEMSRLQKQKENMISSASTQSVSNVEAKQAVVGTQVSNFDNRVENLGATSYNQTQTQLGSGKVSQEAGVNNVGGVMTNEGRGQVLSTGSKQAQMTSGGKSTDEAYAAQGQIQGAQVSSTMAAADISGASMMARMENKGGAGTSQMLSQMGATSTSSNLSKLLAVRGSAGLQQQATVNGASVSMTTNEGGEIVAQTIRQDNSNMFTAQNRFDGLTTQYNSMTSDSSMTTTKVATAVFDYGKNAGEFGAKFAMGRNLSGKVFSNINGVKSPIDMIVGGKVKAGAETVRNLGTAPSR